MKRLLLPLFLLLFLLLVACQAPASPVDVTETSQPASATAPVAETSAPAVTETVAAPTETPPAAEPATVTPTTETPVASAFLCPEIPRPALGMDVLREEHQIVDVFVDPDTGDTCEPNLPEEVGRYQAAGDALYYVAEENGQLFVKQLTAEGSRQLPFTAVDVQGPHHAYHTFIVSPDGTTLAWAAGATAGDGSGETESQMWVGETTTGDAWTPLPPYLSGDSDGLRRVLTPVRFSDDNSILYYSLTPYGIGGAWNAFAGRYDNLYALRLKSEAGPELLFDCSTLGVTLCLGDFFVVDNQASALAYVNAGGDVVVENGAGDVINTIDVDAGYVAYPTWGPSGELVFYAADIEETDGPPRPSAATIYRVAPPTAPAEALISDPNLLPPQAWLDQSRVVVGYSYLRDDQSHFGAAVLDMSGNLRVVESNLVDILPPVGPAQPAATLGEATRYGDETAGVALLYPAAWSVLDVDPASKEESAAYAVTFQSWQPAEPGQDGIPEGATKFDLVVISDTQATSLEEAIAERRAQMAEAEMGPQEILAEQRVRLGNGLEAIRWLIESRGEQAVVYLTYHNERMIMISGLGDFRLIDAIAQTVETVP